MIAAYYLWRGLAPSTRWNYNTPRTHFELFCTLRGYRYEHSGCLPAMATWLIEWLCWLTGSIKVKTMKLYLTSIKSYQLDLGIDFTAFMDLWLEHTLQEIKRDHSEQARRTRIPLTRPHLLHILHYLGRSNYEELMIRAAFTLAFASFLMIREFTYKAIDLQMGPSFQNWVLTKTCIPFINNSEYMELTLPASKTDPFRQEIQLLIAGSHDNACSVVQALKQPIARDTHCPPQAPLFCVGQIAQ